MFKSAVVLGALMATSVAAQDSASFPIKGYEFCTRPAQSLCADTLAPKVNRPAMQQCLRRHFDELPVTCQMNVRNHIFVQTDCQSQGGEVVDQGSCPTGKACHFLNVSHANRCITDP